MGVTIGALIIRIGFWARYAKNIINNHQNSIGNYLNPYITESHTGGARGFDKETLKLETSKERSETF